MGIDRLISPAFLLHSRLVRVHLPLLCISMVLAANFLVFTVVPSEQVMGAVQRIFYFHVGAAMAAYLAIAVLLVASSFYLTTKKVAWDQLAEAAGSVGFVFCSAVLASGMIWGHSAWNVWWRWEPRLVSFLVLWLILFSYIMLRGFSERDARQRVFAAVLGIIAAVNVPIVIYSVKLLEHTQQLHPQVVAKQGLRDTSYVYTLIFSNVTMLVFCAWLIVLRAGSTMLEHRLQSLSRKA